MADALAAAVRSGIFCSRSVEKTKEGHPVRAIVGAGQAANLFNYISTLNGKLGNFTDSATQAFKGLAKTNKALNVTDKVVDFASRNVNPLICLSAGVDVLTSDDKEATLVTNTAALTTMFATESLMKKHLEDVPKMKFMKGISEKVMTFAKKHHCEGKLPSIISGVAFVVGSCTAYDIGNRFGKLLVSKAREGQKTTEDNQQKEAA